MCCWEYKKTARYYSTRNWKGYKKWRVRLRDKIASINNKEAYEAWVKSAREES